MRQDIEEILIKILNENNYMTSADNHSLVVYKILQSFNNKDQKPLAKKIKYIARIELYRNEICIFSSRSQAKIEYSDLTTNKILEIIETYERTRPNYT